MSHAFYSISFPLSQLAASHNMNLRLYPVYLALLSGSEAALAANNAAWNCEQGQNGQWTCLNQGQPAAQPAPVEKSQPKIETAQPAAAPIQHPAPSNQQPSTPAVASQPTPPEKPQTVAAPAGENKKYQVRLEENRKPVIESIPAKAQPAPAAEPATTTAATGGRQGWTCKSGDQKTSWNCNLVGPDPKGEARNVSASASESLTPSVIMPTYNQSQERTFQTLRREFAEDPWQNCANWSARRKRIKPASNQSRDSASTLVDADSSEVFDGEVLNFAGSVDLHRGDQHLMADHASYDTVAETMDAQGHVRYSDSSMAMSSETMSMSLDRDQATLRDTQFIIAAAPLRGSAATVYRDNKDLSRYQDATFTSCPPGNQDWLGHASKVKVNRETGQGAAKNAWLEFKGVPVLYTPYISFPTDDRRLSGLLPPYWSKTQRNGFDVSMPFYWNIAPNIDDTITPRYMGRRGGMLTNKFRYMTEISQGSLLTQYLPNDQLLNRSRYLGSFKDQARFSEYLSSNINLNYVSDKTYFNDLNNALGIQTQRFLPSNAFVNYNRPDISFATGIQHYQMIEKKVELKNTSDASDPLSLNYAYYRSGVDAQSLYNAKRTPYSVLPKVALNAEHHFENLPVALGLDSQFNYFSHNQLVTGQRFNIAPSMSLPVEGSAGFFIPKITGHFTQYQLGNQAEQSVVGKQASSISRTLPIFSVDSGLAFEKALDFGGKSYTNTLEPRAFYLYIPYKDQSAIPLFDTALYDTNFYSLFRENRFSGGDRIQDANQITLAATSRFLDNSSGLEPLKVSLGQIIYFANRNVDSFYRYDPLFNTSDPGYLNAVHATQTSNTSNFVGEVGGQITRNLSHLTGAQWNPEENSISRWQAGLKYHNEANEIINLGYRFRDSSSNQSVLNPTTISQTDVSFRWPLFNDWYGLGRWQYSLNFDKTTESFIGLEKESCCWRFRILGRRYINGAGSGISLANNNLKPETAFFVQLELKGLSSFGDNLDQFLQKRLTGYRKEGFFED